MKAQHVYFCVKCESPYPHLEDAEGCCEPPEGYMCRNCGKTFAGDSEAKASANACCKKKRSVKR